MTGWLVVVPIKRFTTGKSRLQILDRVDIARAVALDTLQVLTSVPAVRRVLVVTDDPRDGVWPSAVAVLNQGRPGLNAAVGEGIDVARRLDPSAPVAVVLGDLPGITPMAVTAAFAVAARVRTGFVGDAAGTGTTIATIAPGVRFTPRFGPGSGARHRASGAFELPAGAALRQDLDTAADLPAVRPIAGRRLAALLASSSVAV